MRFLAKTCAFALPAAAILTSSPPVSAGCHLIDCVEDVFVEPQELGDASCETLWILRNSIFDAAGYCFKSERAKSFFINDGCTHVDLAAVPINDYQRHNIGVIARVEKKKSC